MRLTLKSPEVALLVGMLVLSVLAIVFMHQLVAAPKLLFGRSLSALEPGLFPSLVLSALGIICVICLFMINKTGSGYQDDALSRTEWVRGTVFFAIMIFYALTMQPFGFLISSAIAITLISLHLGSRSIVQIGLLAFVAPVLLYLAATRLLAVSLPELNLIELAYARLLGH